MMTNLAPPQIRAITGLELAAGVFTKCSERLATQLSIALTSGRRDQGPTEFRIGINGDIYGGMRAPIEVGTRRVDIAYVNPAALGYHLESGNALTFEVVPRRIEDRGGGLARVNGQIRLLEGLAQPREEDELNLSYYNTMTTWIQIDPLLQLFGLTREDLQRGDEAQLAKAVRKVAHRIPTYVTIKDVKYRWGHGQEDIYPVAQIEKLWSDMSALTDIQCGYIAVPRYRGQQMKDPAQLDSWVTDGSKDHVASLCHFQ